MLTSTSRGRRCAVLGAPIAHSLSPALHRAAYAELGLTDWVYDRFEVGRGELAGFVHGCDAAWRGLSLTMPLKEEALHLGEVTDTAALTRAANTLIFEPDRRTLHNTDVEGFRRPLAAHAPIDSAVILGAGATARSAFLALATLGIATITVSARTRQRIAEWEPLLTATGLTPQIVAFGDLPPAQLVVATVPKGVADPLADRIAARAEIVFDALYDPWPTPLAEAAARRGRLVLSGLDLLVHQAIGQFELMTAHTVPAGVLLSAGWAALGERSHT